MMAATLSQEEILENTKTVLQRFETLKSECRSMLNCFFLPVGDAEGDPEENSFTPIEETIVRKTLEKILQGVEEAQACVVTSFL